MSANSIYQFTRKKYLGYFFKNVKNQQIYIGRSEWQYMEFQEWWKGLAKELEEDLEADTHN